MKRIDEIPYQPEIKQCSKWLNELLIEEIEGPTCQKNRMKELIVQNKNLLITAIIKAKPDS